MHFVREKFDCNLKGGVLLTIYLQTSADFSENDSMQFNKNMSVFRNFHRIIIKV